MRCIELKAARALEHLEALKHALQFYYDSTPYEISHHKKPEIGRRVLRIDLRGPDDIVYLSAGDFAHNLRSSLDHVVYALIVGSTKNLPDSAQVQWPVQSRKDPKAFDRQTEDVPIEAKAIIESLQPYHEGPDDAFKQSALWQLHKLDIIDKHRRIAINEHALDSYSPSLGKSSDFTTQIVDGGFEISFPIDAPPVEMQLNPKPTVLFGDAGEGLFVSAEQLASIFEFVTQSVLPRFSRFLDQDTN
jgi:hypothetical protein